MTILYAEDDVDDFYFFCEVLKQVNPQAECINTRDGIETIHYLENASVLPEIIVLDINMPAMDGKACLKNIKRDQKFKDIPVIVYTTSINPRDMEHCLQLGAIEYLEKPTSAEQAHERLSKFFKLH